MKHLYLAHVVLGGGALIGAKLEDAFSGLRSGGSELRVAFEGDQQRALDALEGGRGGGS